ncbi:hypothetical protein [Vibrio coralliilyticus]|uniref:Uncharacterized protein n=1 Tax=Vibrio coralliilyticus TaxID=190893 RepID=A0AAP7DFG5_9VIBR|nr:hypothetical protein [Vibrio coralliilyticus]NOI32247.1 hypothetical protein [Vibrio coralliilyticus]NOJ25331.1 hypothetical protein [Vibrio coralliilyticus]
MEKITVIAATVSAKSRHKDDRRELTVFIPSTELNMEYWGQGIARNHVTSVLHKLNLKSYSVVKKWICDNGNILNPDGEILSKQ